MCLLMGGCQVGQGQDDLRAMLHDNKLFRVDERTDGYHIMPEITDWFGGICDVHFKAIPEMTC